jgi:hypothetical protein
MVCILAQIVHVSPDSSDIRDFGQVPFGDSLPTAFPVITRSMQNSSAVSVDSASVTVLPVARSALPLIPVLFHLFCLLLFRSLSLLFPLVLAVNQLIST